MAKKRKYTTSRFTRSHYTQIALAINKVLKTILKDDIRQNREVTVTFCQPFCLMFIADNNKFDPRRFINMCITGKDL